VPIAGTPIGCKCLSAGQAWQGVDSPLAALWAGPSLFAVCRLLGFGLCLLLLTACEEREAPTRGQIMAFADHLLEREGWDWGPIERVWPPSPGPDDRRWWQIDYHGPTASGRLPVVLVDAASGWARLPPPDHRVRVPLQRVAPDEAEVVETPWQPEQGSWILLLERGGDEQRFAAEAEELNRLARATGLRPLFVAHHPRLGPAQLVYGWTGEHGIIPDQRIVAWLRRHRPGGTVLWVDLGGP